MAFWSAFEIVAVISSVRQQMRADLERVGWDVINVHASPNPLEFLRHRLTVSDSERFAELVSGVSAPANLMPSVVRPASPGAADAPPQETTSEAVLLIGTNADWNAALDMEFLSGRFFEAGEVDVCVVDEWVFRRVFPERSPERPGASSITLTVGVAEKPFRVVGVARDPFQIRDRFEEWDVMGAARSHVIRFMEYKNVYVPRQAIAISPSIVGAVIKVGPGVDPEAGARDIREYLDAKGSTAWAWSRREWATTILDATSILTAISNFIWFVVLVVTAFMVVTVVFIVVRERYPEIAVRRVEGARRGQITTQLVLENLFLALLAATIAWLLALLGGRWLEDYFFGWPVSLLLGDSLMVGGTGAFLVAVTTLLPAHRAASIDPVAVLTRR